MKNKRTNKRKARDKTMSTNKKVSLATDKTTKNV